MARKVNPEESKKENISLLAAAKRVFASKNNSGAMGASKKTGAGWQEDAWNAYDNVGELRFIVNSLAGLLAKARLYVATIDENGDIQRTENPDAQAALRSFGDSFSDTSQLLERMGQNLLVPGEVWLVGLPPVAVNGQTPEPNALNRRWEMLSISEISRTQDGVEIQLDGEKVKYPLEELHLVRVHRPHPRRFDEATSAVRSSLPVLRELIGLTMHISAQVDSRLAGAGLLVIPDSAANAMKNNALASTYGPQESGVYEFMETLADAMTTPIGDRSSASAVVPLTVTKPDGVGDFQYLSFASNLDGQAQGLREESIRRLALAMDAPPEVLLGTADMNHWSSWLINEETISTHIEPLLNLIVDALTREFLWEALEVAGVDNARDFFVWYETDHMKARPNQGAEAQNLHSMGLLSGRATREANGFQDSDAQNPAHVMALKMIADNPALMTEPGTAEVVRQIQALMDGDVNGLTVPDTTAPPQGIKPAPTAPRQMNPVTPPDTNPRG